MLQIQKSSNSNGVIYLVGVPIGNADDITYRAVEVLKNVDFIFAEDTRKTGLLLSSLGINDKTIYAHHEHNQNESAKGIIKLAKEGSNIAIVSDAGTPGISDPGYVVSKLAAESDVDVVPISGPCAATLALISSGLSTSSFVFLGFLPRTKSQIESKLEDYKDLKDTLVIYESPRRIIKTIEYLIDILGDRKAFLARELTKIYEEFLRGTLTEINQELSSRDKVLGEICLVIEGRDKQKVFSDEDLSNDILSMIEEGHSAKEIKEELSKKYKINKKEVYQSYLKQIKS